MLSEASPEAPHEGSHITRGILKLDYMRSENHTTDKGLISVRFFCLISAFREGLVFASKTRSREGSNNKQEENVRTSTAFKLILSLALVFSATASGWAADSFYPFIYTNKNDVMLSEKPGQNPIKLGTGKFPTLSPGGKQAAWVEQIAEFTARLVVRDIASGKSSTVAQQGTDLFMPRWSPKGDVIAYVSRTGGDNELWTVKPGSQPVLLAKPSAEAGVDFYEPVWSPDGERVCYQDMTYFYQMTLDGKIASRTELSTFGGPEGSFDSSDRLALRPNAPGIILFSMTVPVTTLNKKKSPDSSMALFLYDSATKTSTRLTAENIFAMDPMWSANGEEILFHGTVNASQSKYRVYSLRPGEAPKELLIGQDAMPPAK